MSHIELNDGGRLVVKSGATDTASDGAIINARISTSSVDAYGDIVHQGPNDKGQGWLLDRFNAHPVMLWQHNMADPSIGGGRVYLGDDPAFGLSLFLTPDFDMDDPLAARVEGKVKRKVIRESSVGFRSIISAPMDGGRGIEFFEHELIEVSWCNRGANPDTETLIKSMIGRNADLAALVDSKDCADVETIKAEMQESHDVLAERIKTLEAVISNMGDLAERRAEEITKHEDAFRDQASGMVKRLAEAGLIHD